MPLEQSERGRQWHITCPETCEDQWCSHISHEEEIKAMAWAKEMVAESNRRRSDGA